MLILGTFRPEELVLGDGGGRHSLEKVLHEFERRFGDICVDLSGSDGSHGLRFVDALLDSPASPLARNRLDGGFRAALAQHTGGHALFTTEVLRDLQERDDLSQDEQGCWIVSPTLDWGQLPPRVEAVIKERVDRLVPELRQLLQVASMEGERFTAQVVAQVQGLGERETLRALSHELGARHRLVREAGEERTGEHYLSRYQFAHVLFQAYLYDSLSPGERRLLHREVGSALEALYEGHTEEIAAQLASHFAGAGDAERERRYAKMAGERAAAGFAWEEAIRYLSRALDLTPEADSDERFKILLACERMHDVHGDRESQAADLALLDELARGQEDDQQAAGRRAMATLRRAKYAEALYDLPAGSKLSQVAIECARTAGDRRVEGEGCWNWGFVLLKQGDAAGAQLRFEQGLAMARQTNYRWLEAACVRGVGCIYRSQGDFEAAKSYLQDALRLSREAGDFEGEALALWHLGETSSEEDNTATAIDFLQQAAVFSRRIGYRYTEAAALNSLGRHLIRQSRYGEAQACLERALHMYREMVRPGGQASALDGLGWLHCEYTGDYERSRACGDEALRLCQPAGYAFTAARADVMICFAYHYQGDYCAATSHLKRFQGFADNRDDWWEQTALGIVGVALNAMALGDYAGAEARLLEARATNRGILADDHDDVAWVESALALLYHQLGEDQKGLGYAERAVAIHRKNGHVYRTGTALNRLGHTRAALGQLTEATTAYEDALDLRRKLGQAHLAPESLAGLARVALAQGNAAATLPPVEQILEHLKNRGPSTGTACPIDGTDEPIRIYLTCYQVLRANGDPCAEEILEAAYSLLQSRADKIDDADLRRSYLEGVAANREIIALRTDPKGF